MGLTGRDLVKVVAVEVDVKEEGLLAGSLQAEGKLSLSTKHLKLLPPRLG